MSLLHVHVISQDYLVDSLKIIRMFRLGIDAAEVIDDLQVNASVRVDTERTKKTTRSMFVEFHNRFDTETTLIVAHN